MYTIVQSPDPTLNQVCEPCELDDKSLAKLSKLAKEMKKLMYSTYGVGIAAPQVGVSKRLIVIDVDYADEDGEPNPIVLVNPEILELKGEPEKADEGCLSCPGIQVPVSRQPWASVRYHDLNGEQWIIEGDGLLGRCLQHEIDHLNGKTLFEACDPIDRIEALRNYEKALAAGAKPGDVSIEGR